MRKKIPNKQNIMTCPNRQPEYCNWAIQFKLTQTTGEKKKKKKEEKKEKKKEKDKVGKIK